MNHKTESCFWRIASVILVVAFVLTLASAQTDLEVITEDDGDLLRMEDIQEVAKSLQLMLELKSEQLQNAKDGDEQKMEEENGACQCRGLTCQCCKRIRIKKFRFDKTCCLSVTYLKRNIGIRVVLKFGNRILYSHEISARNPPPVCIKFPILSKAAKLCLTFYDLHIDARSFGGCSSIQVKLFFATILKVNLGCFRMNFVSGDTTETAETVELPYLETARVEQGSSNLFFLLLKTPMEKIEPPGAIIDEE